MLGWTRLVELLVGVLKRPAAKLAVVAVWLSASVAGLLVFSTFTKELQSSLPPVPGTPSYEAAAAATHYFPIKPLNNAFLLTSADATPFLKFNESSSCRIAEPAVTPGPSSISIDFVCKGGSKHLLGTGCITKKDLVGDIENKTSGLLQNLVKLKLIDKTKMDAIMRALKEQLPPLVPEITECPWILSSTGQLTQGWVDFVPELHQVLTTKFPRCTHTLVSLQNIPSQTVNFSQEVEGRNLTLSLTIPGGSFWTLFKRQFMADSLSASLVAALTSTCDGSQVDPTKETARHIADVLQDLAAHTNARTPALLTAQVSSQSLMLNAIQGGITQTMDLSSRTLPIALLILAGMLRNLRLVMCTVVNLVACLASAILIMHPVAMWMSVATVAPSLMVATSLAMSIDYSLFLLGRFQQELGAGRPADEAVVISLATSGKIVLVSGATLLLCFAVMLCLPVQLIASLGVGAAVTVFMAVVAALTLTPVMLLTCPNFFGSNKYWGLSNEGCCCVCQRRPQPVGGMTEVSWAPRHPPAPAPDDAANSLHTTSGVRVAKRSCWPRFGNVIQRLALPVLLFLIVLATPFAVFGVPALQHSVGLLPLMPTDSQATQTLMALQGYFGVGSLFPTTLIIVPKAGAMDTSATRSQWLGDTCAALKAIATAVNTNPKVAPFTASSFTGAMILDGNCTTMGRGQWSSIGGSYSATEVMINYQLDPFAADGQAWISRLRQALEAHHDLGSWFVFGEGPSQMDVADKTYARFPVMIALMMCAVFFVIGISFRSVVAPIRAALCLLWMLAVTFGLAVFTFQDGLLSFLHWPQVGARSTGAMCWLSPCIACSVLVGLGLDYDIFYSERVAEECEHGLNERDASLRALSVTANTISAAGIIMVAAFLALLLCTTPALNEISFLLIIGVIVDCFITTKLIVPCVTALLGRWNFWPRKFGTQQQIPTLNAGLVTVE